jgi:Xaa-Pro dipeptidase
VSTPWHRGANVRAVNLELVRTAVAEVKNIMAQHKVADLPVAVDETELYLLEALQEVGLRVANGYDAMFDARAVKSPDELKIIEISASLVDGVYAHLVDIINSPYAERQLPKKHKKR